MPKGLHSIGMGGWGMDWALDLRHNVETNIVYILAITITIQVLLEPPWWSTFTGRIKVSLTSLQYILMGFALFHAEEWTVICAKSLERGRLCHTRSGSRVLLRVRPKNKK